MKGRARFSFYVYGELSMRFLFTRMKITRQWNSTLSDNHSPNEVALTCRPMPDRYVERYGPMPDGTSRHPVSKPLSRPVKRRTSIDDEGHKKKGWFKQIKIRRK